MNFSQLILRKLPITKPGLLSPASLTKPLISRKSTNQTSSSSSNSSSSSDDEAKKKPSNTDAVERLNLLLQQMVTAEPKSELKLAQPANKRDQGRKEKEERLKKQESAEKKIVRAAKDVAVSLGGNTSQTESELLMKLLNTANSTSSSSSLSDVLKGMKIEREPKPQESKAEQVRNILQKFQTRNRNEEQGTREHRIKQSSVPVTEIQPESVRLFDGEDLGIFSSASDLKESPQLQTWQKLLEKELKLAVTHPPSNYFQEMILWTEQGKLWQFPINNEFGLEEESKVYFADHVFLDEYLEPWCPQRGPIRHFMELVCVGLSKNPYLTVEAKKEHIEWYKNYFEEKRKLLVEVGALPDVDASQQKSID